MSYNYVVAPFLYKFPTRHEAVGYCCVAASVYPLDFKIVPVEEGSSEEDYIELVKNRLDDIEMFHKGDRIEA